MQYMQEPEGRSYNEGYPEAAGNPINQDDEQARWSQPQYQSQQKLQPEARLGTANLVLAIMSVVASSVIMGLSIALVALTANVFGRIIAAGVVNTLPYGVFGISVAGFVIALILLLFSIAGFVFSIVQLSIMTKKRRRARGAIKSRLRY
jgi:uncharacterized membrane protein